MWGIVIELIVTFAVILKVLFEILGGGKSIAEHAAKGAQTAKEFGDVINGVMDGNVVEPKKKDNCDTYGDIKFD